LHLQKFGLKAVAGEYAGAATILNFGSAAAELDALRHGCGIFDLGWRGKLVLSGEDRVRWLNGMVTNNTRDLAQDCGNFSYVLNAQGQIQGELAAYQRGEFFVLESEARQIAGIREFLEKFIIMDDVEIGEISGKLTSIGVAGPRALEVLRRAGLTVSELKLGQIVDGSWEGRGFSAVRDTVPVRGWYELWLAPENVEAFWTALLAAGAVAVGAEALEWQRILLGVPRVGVDTAGRMVQETGQNYALNDSKGCYIGQEIVERVRARGQVHRRFVGLVVEGAGAEDGSLVGHKIMAGEKEAGEITSSAEMVVDGVRRRLALGYVRHNFIGKSGYMGKGGASDVTSPDGEPEASLGLMVDGCGARIVALPFEVAI
jgi:aminomethyltransferase